MGKEERNAYTIKNDANIGEVKIADEVVAIIAGLAAMEVEGVASMAGNATRELISKLGMKSLSKGVKVDVLDGIVTVSLTLNLLYGYGVKDISVKVQEKCQIFHREHDRTGSCRCEYSRCRRESTGGRLSEKIKNLREHIFRMVFGLDFNEGEEIPEQIQLYFEQLDDVKRKRHGVHP